LTTTAFNSCAESKRGAVLALWQPVISQMDSFAFKWTDHKTGKPQSRAGMQSYRTEDGKLVET
jgi:hypothetical protein